MSDNVTSVSFSVSGEDALEQARMFLNQLESQGPFSQVKFELYTDQGSKPTENEVQTKLSVGDGASVSTKESGERHIQQDSSHHNVLKTLSTLEAEFPVPAGNILERLDLKKGTVYGALSQLHDRGLVDRIKNESGSYEYSISEVGYEQLGLLEDE